MDSDFSDVENLIDGSDEDYEVSPVKPKAKPRAKKTAPRAKGKAKKAVLKEQDTNVDMGHDDDETVQKPISKEDASKISNRYQKMTQIEHIMKRPDTYIGSVEPNSDNSMWVVEDGKMTFKNITYVPGLYKIFDEILVNAADHKKRDATMKNIKVTIDTESGTITVLNDGNGIPVVMHEEHNCYIPELIFGHLLTGENFDDSEERVVGGRNGYGAKLANIFSTKFVVETNEGKGGQKYSQTWTNNMSQCAKPKLTKGTGKSYTSISFTPDFERFSMPNGLDSDTLALMTKRVYDIAGTSEKSLKVYLNGDQVPVGNFEQYVDMYLQGSGTDMKKEDTPKIFERINDRWEICITASDGQPQQVSYVNSIATVKGGEHVKYIADQVADRLVTYIKKKDKGSTIKPKLVKNNLWVFVNATIANPAFDSQCKETLTTRWQKFGDKEFLPSVSEKVLKKIEKSPIVENILFFSKAKQMRELNRKGGVKKTKITGIPKLSDANEAGGRNSEKCTLILTEGDSAKSLAMAGLSIIGRDYYGAFPLKGKLLNVRDAGHSQIMKNDEIQNIMKITGLKVGNKYESTKGLRYGHIMIMADQDHDGSHIKGLLMNFLHHYWPSLLQVPGFLQVFITPIVKATKGKKKLAFYTMPEYEQWVESQGGRPKGWTVKYYKGLGTSTSKEAQEYFADLEKHRINMVWEGDQGADALDMAFSKKRVEDRKLWLGNFEEGTRMDYDTTEIEYQEFVNKELILFSMADNMRSIPCMVDGLKPSQRKVLFCAFKRNLKTDIRVSQFAGYVSEHSAYHHGEVSLSSTIVGLAHDFVGSNNVNLLVPSGQFGTRDSGGKDGASSRYIHTRLAPLARKIFHPDDDAILDYLVDDGQSIEPKWYMPVIPLVLVNGCSGIGTGWSTDIPNFNPRDLIQLIRQRISGVEGLELVPWYRGFVGTIDKEVSPRKGFEGKYSVNGVMEVDEESLTIRVTELPVGLWTKNYKTHLEDAKVFPDGSITDIRENHTDVAVDFTITLSEAFFKQVANSAGGFEKVFKMKSSVSTTNMHCFNSVGLITKYESADDILNSFFALRLDYYGKRKAHLTKEMKFQLDKCENKARFISMIIDGELVISKKKKAILVQELADLGFKPIEPEAPKSLVVPEPGEEEDNDDEQIGAVSAKAYDYLLSMQLWNLTAEKVDKIMQELKEVQESLARLTALSPAEIWLTDLTELETALDEFDDYHKKQADLALDQARQAQGKQKKKPRAKAKKKSAPKVVAIKDEEEFVPVLAKTSTSDRTKAAPKPKHAPPKSLAAPTVVQVDDEEEEEMLSLTERINRRLKLSKHSVPKPNEKEDDIFEELDDSDDDAEATPAKPKVRNSRKRAKEKTPAKKNASVPLTSLEALRISENDSPARKSPAPKKVKKTNISKLIGGCPNSLTAPCCCEEGSIC